MTFYEKLAAIWKKNDSMVCVGLDPDLNKLPERFKKSAEPFLDFNKFLVDETCELVCAYKPQAAYYAGQNADDQLAASIAYIKHNHPEIPVILDVKRGDIGSTAAMYAREAFERYGADAVTVNPYMGSDALKPFLDYADKGVIVLCRTSNPGGGDLQNLVCDGRPLYEHVAELSRDKYNYNRNVALVIGATYPEELGKVRAICPDMPFLVPGVGAQGGDVAKVLEHGMTADGYGLVINSSRGIIYAADPKRAALELRDVIRRSAIR